MSAIARVETASLGEVREALTRRHFLIVTRALGERGPRGLESLEALVRSYPLTLVETTHGRLTIEAFAAKMRVGAERPSTMAGDSTEVPAELLPTLSRMPVFEHFAPRYFEFFLGAAGTATSLHSDAYDGLCMNLFGRKRWLVVAASQVELLAPIESLVGFQRSTLDPRTDRGRELLEARGVKFIEFIVGPGELVVVPPACFHFVQALEHSLSVRINLSENG